MPRRVGSHALEPFALSTDCDPLHSHVHDINIALIRNVLPWGTRHFRIFLVVLGSACLTAATPSERCFIYDGWDVCDGGGGMRGARLGDSVMTRRVTAKCLLFDDGKGIESDHDSGSGIGFVLGASPPHPISRLQCKLPDDSLSILYARRVTSEVICATLDGVRSWADVV